MMGEVLLWRPGPYFVLAWMNEGSLGIVFSYPPLGDDGVIWWSQSFLSHYYMRLKAV